ncbi:MAG: hypothetical protein R3C97_03305 [Geminicoccaceae bacterium]
MAQDRLGSFERYVKMFNLVAGIILVVGTAFLIGTFVVRAMGKGEQATGGDAVLALPAEARLVDTAVGDNRLLLTLEASDGSRFL